MGGTDYSVLNYDDDKRPPKFIVRHLVAMSLIATWHLDSALKRSWAGGGLTLSSGFVHWCRLPFVSRHGWFCCWQSWV